ncbi:N-acetylmuramoyl-L-alanine amidase [uncultured Mucilaginibacter sp.]|uniref:N-acetylmuramoyl-L-alanine amidase family protein n=1 Tax=uncultured Mucilaginibacter sp. TaxID=797541 RepID=UPI0025F72674|nr:N-acetylmuramoyl-L-alanine amidase [uncultured Mucilaginibacter sp.]
MKNKALKRLICCLWVILCLSASHVYAYYPVVKKDTTNNFRVRTIVIDPGHGGHTGAKGTYSTEEQVTLALGFKLQKAIQKEIKDVRVVMTRTTPDGVSLQARADIANEAKGDLFISLHCNALPEKIHIVHGKKVRIPDHSGKGVLELVYILRRDKEEGAALRENLFDEKDTKGGPNLGFDPTDPGQMIILNAFKAKYRKNSILFANLVNDEFVQTDGRPSDGVLEQSIHVLCHTAMPSVLIETGFIDNPAEEDFLNSEDGQNQIVASIVRAIINYKKEIEPI